MTQTFQLNDCCSSYVTYKFEYWQNDCPTICAPPSLTLCKNLNCFGESVLCWESEMLWCNLEEVRRFKVETSLAILHCHRINRNDVSPSTTSTQTEPLSHHYSGCLPIAPNLSFRKTWSTVRHWIQVDYNRPRLHTNPVDPHLDLIDWRVIANDNFGSHHSMLICRWIHFR